MLLLNLVEVETAHDARVGVDGVISFTLDNVDGLLSWLSNGAFSFDGRVGVRVGGLSDFVADHALVDALLHLAGIVTASRSGSGSSRWSSDFGRSWGAIRAGVRASTSVRARASVGDATFRVVDDLRTRESIGRSGIVNVGNQDTSVSIRVTTGESDDLGGKLGIGARRCTKTDLSTSGIELSTTFGHGIMKANQLVTDEVFTTWQVCRESDGKLSVEVIVIIGHEPRTIVLSSFFVNLEPLSLRCVECGAASFTAGCHVG